MSQAAAGPGGEHSSRRGPEDPLDEFSGQPIAARRAMPRGLSRAWLAVEWGLLFAVLPTMVALKWLPLHILMLLVLAGAGCLVFLLLDRSFDRRQLWNLEGAARGIRQIVITFGVLAAMMALAVWLMTPERFLDLVTRKPVVWAVIMIGYPIVSVYPQEIIFRTFMFHRYERLFTDRRVMIAMSALAFGYAHVFFENNIAVLMTLVGGALFAWTYDKTRSTFAVWIEHGLYGCFIFTIGLGRFFFSGAIGSV
jgi:uncharacterized protein